MGQMCSKSSPPVSKPAPTTAPVAPPPQSPKSLQKTPQGTPQGTPLGTPKPPKDEQSQARLSPRPEEPRESPRESPKESPKGSAKVDATNEAAAAAKAEEQSNAGKKSATNSRSPSVIKISAVDQSNPVEPSPNIETPPTPLGIEMPRIPDSPREGTYAGESEADWGPPDMPLALGAEPRTVTIAAHAQPKMETSQCDVLLIDHAAKRLSIRCGCDLGPDHDILGCRICRSMDASDAPLLN